MIYDVTLRELFQELPVELLRLLLGSPPLRMLPASLPRATRREADLVVDLANGDIGHVEVQTRSDREMIDRMLGYRWLLRALYPRRRIRQMVAHVGIASCDYEHAIDEPGLRFGYELINLAKVPSATLLESTSRADRILALACDGDRPRILRRLYEEIAREPETARRDLSEKVLILSELLGIDNVAIEESTHVPLTLDLMESRVFGKLIVEQLRAAEARGLAQGEAKGVALGQAKGLAQGQAQGLIQGQAQGIAQGLVQGLAQGQAQGQAQGLIQGQARILTLVLERKFGAVPDSVRSRVEAASPEQIEAWTLRAMEADTLAGVFA